VVPSTPHSLYTITIHTNPPVLPTIPTRHTSKTHETQAHTKHTSHKSPIIPQPYTTRHTLIAFHTSSYSQSCRNITTPTRHRHTNPTQTHTHKHTPHSPKDDLAPTHTHTTPNHPRSHCLAGILQDPCSHCLHSTPLSHRLGGQQLGLTPKLLRLNTRPLLVNVCVTALYYCERKPPAYQGCTCVYTGVIPCSCAHVCVCVE
jgi:hypothetical protein